MCIRIYLPFCFTQSFVPIQRLISEFIDRNATIVRRPQSCKRPDPRLSSFAPTDLIKNSNRIQQFVRLIKWPNSSLCTPKEGKTIFLEFNWFICTFDPAGPNRLLVNSESEFQISNRSEFLVQVSIALGF